MRQLICSAAIGVAVAVAPMSGCAILRVGDAQSAPLTTTQRYQVSVQAYIAAVNLMTRLASSGNVSREDAEAFELARVSANSLLGDWRMAITNGTEFDELAALDAALDALIRASARADQTSRNLIKGGA